MRIVVVCVGRVREPFADDCAHYERLLARHASLSTVEIKEAGLDASESDRARSHEAREVERRIPDRSYVCAVDRSGRQFSSLGFSSFLEDRRQQGRDLCFLIGGPYGLEPSLVSGADAVLSLGEFTFPHQLARVLLTEQLFRAHKILAGERYHY